MDITLFKHGAAKLQSGSSSQLCLTGNDGGMILAQSATSGDFTPYSLSPAGRNVECFNGSCCVEGVPSQSLQPNTLYSVYLHNLDGTDANCQLQFWRTFAGFNPTIDPHGIYVGNTGGINIGLTYLGQLYTGSSNISTLVAPGEHLQQPCYSHYNPWTFGFQTTFKQVNSFTQGMSGTQSSPSILTVTEGVSESPEFTGTLQFYGNASNTIGGYVTFGIEVSGTAINGVGGSTPWSVTTELQRWTITKDNQWITLTANWMSAPPIGVYTAKPVINYTGAGSLLYRCGLLGKLSL